MTKMKIIFLLLSLQLAAVGVTSLCSTGRVYVGNVDMSNAELIVFNGIYVQLSNSSVQLPIYKHESREQFLHVVFVERRPYWRIGIRRVGGQIDFVDYLGAPSVDDERVTSPDMTSRWHVWSTRSHSWSPVPRLRATCVEPDFVTCTSGLLTVSGLTTRHQRWHGMRTGTYRITSQTNDLRPVYKHHIRDEYLFFVDEYWFIGTEVGSMSGVMFVRDGAWRPEHVLATWEVFSGSHLESDSGLRIRCKGDTTANGDDDEGLVDAVTTPAQSVDVDDVLEWTELDGDAIGETSAAHVPQEQRGVDETTTTVDERLCGTHMCHTGRGHCELMTDGPLCVCVDGYYGPDCQQLIECGVPLQCFTSALVAQTGRSFLDVAVFQCDVDGGAAVTGSVCQLDGTWSRATSQCVQQTHFITPEHPFVPPPRQ